MGSEPENALFAFVQSRSGDWKRFLELIGVFCVHCLKNGRRLNEEKTKDVALALNWVYSCESDDFFALYNPSETFISVKQPPLDRSELCTVARKLSLFHSFSNFHLCNNFRTSLPRNKCAFCWNYSYSIWINLFLAQIQLWSCGRSENSVYKLIQAIPSVSRFSLIYAQMVYCLDAYFIVSSKDAAKFKATENETEV